MNKTYVTLHSVKGLPVVTRAEGGHAGKVDDVLVRVVDLVAIGYKVRAPGFWGEVFGVVAEAVERLGRDFVIVRDDAAVEPAGASRGSLDDRVWWSDWQGSKCIGRRGEDHGKLTDLILEREGGRIRALVLDRGRLVVPSPRSNITADGVIVDDASAITKIADAVDSAAWWAAVEVAIG